MKAFQLTLTAMLLLGLTTAAVAQNIFGPTMSSQLHFPPTDVPNTGITSQDSIERHREIMLSPTAQLAKQNSIRHNMLSSWTGDGTSELIRTKVHDANFREAFGISPEQYQAIMRGTSGRRNDPDERSLSEEMKQLSLETPGGLFSMDTPEEAQMKYAELNQKMNDITLRYREEVIYETLTPDQLKTIREFQIAIMSETFFVSSNMFEALDLSDEQKQQLEEIKMKLNPEFERIANKYLDRELPQSQLFDKLTNAKTPEEEERIQKELRELRQDPQEMKEIMESSKGLANELKVEMFDVLTDEQWDRFQMLVDDPPDYIKKIITQVRKQREIGAAKPSTTGSGTWQPGPNSWRPGDPIPEGYRQQRQERGRFPRTEQSE